MIRAIDIKKWGKLLIMLAAAVFLLSACSDKTTQAVKGTEAEEAIEQSRAECWQKAVLEPVYKTIGKVVMGMYEQLSRVSQPDYDCFCRLDGSAYHEIRQFGHGRQPGRSLE